MPSLGGWEIVILIGILVLLFGAKRLPDMARSIGQSARVFKGEMKGMKNDEGGADKPAPEKPAAEPTPPSALPPATAEQHTKASQPSPGNTGQ
ncbi:Sec-independent protein translocase subunit TatA [Actinomycetes bacterium KLBMP 9759]